MFFAFLLVFSAGSLSPLQASGQESGEVFCHNWKRNLAIWDHGEDVAMLITALEKEGFPVGGGDIFGRKTLSAVIKFQEKYSADILSPSGLEEGSGFAGTLTRNKLNSLYGCGNETEEVISDKSSSGSFLPDQARSSLAGIGSAFPAKKGNSAILSFDLSTQNEDKAGKWGVFSAGKGSGENADDWGWTLKIAFDESKKINSFNIRSVGDSNRWSTDSESDYPLVVFQGNKQLNSSYKQVFGPFDPGVYEFKMYGQKESALDSGVNIIVSFEDKTEASSSIGLQNSKEDILKNISDGLLILNNILKNKR